MADEVTPEEVNELKSYLGMSSTDNKSSVHAFLSKVVDAKDTTKLGNLDTTELGNLNNPVRAFKHLSIFASEVMRNPELANFFNANAELGTSTSLSKGGLLVKLAVTTKKDSTLADITKEKKPNKGWFGSKKEDKDETTEQ